MWNKFYAGDEEPELDDPLIEAGKDMTLVICEAVRNRDMFSRRYAIGALGFIGDKRALPNRATHGNILAARPNLEFHQHEFLIAQAGRGEAHITPHRAIAGGQDDGILGIVMR